MELHIPSLFKEEGPWQRAKVFREAATQRNDIEVRFARIKLVPSSEDDTVVDGPWVITQKLASLSKAGSTPSTQPFLSPEFLAKRTSFET
ncbi:uncharacterized protein BDW70DRAFT_159767 [Aspergillus foveolatus]|uniref:uncharacterized protein n=1 Tax=Aspergillus foveolatus TaxID=210207 RepID=UPI003CCC927B